MPITTDEFNSPGFRLGHWTHPSESTGCTVLLADKLVPAAVDVRGGAPGTRETDLLGPGKSVQRLDAVVLTGGSAFGLASTDGVVRWLHEHGRGYPTAATPVPIVAGAVIYDLRQGNLNWPDSEAGYEAAAHTQEQWVGGNIGAGSGASVSKILGRENAVATGIGIAQVDCPAGRISAVIVNNAFGDVWPANSAHPLTFPANGTLSTEDVILQSTSESEASSNTVIGAITVSRPLDHNALTRIAVAGQSGIARSIHPAHTPADGDTIFALATDEGPCSSAELMQLTTAAQIATSAAIRSTVSVHSQL